MKRLLIILGVIIVPGGLIALGSYKLYKLFKGDVYAGENSNNNT